MDSTSDISIGQRIAMYRKLRGFTQEGLGMRLHRSKSWVTKIERGERSIDSITVLLQVARALGVEVQKLTGRPYFPEPGGRAAGGAEALSELRRVLIDARRILRKQCMGQRAETPDGERTWYRLVHVQCLRPKAGQAASQLSTPAASPTSPSRLA